MGNVEWETYLTLRDRICTSCGHAFEFHGSGGFKTVCWVSGCTCEQAG